MGVYGFVPWIYPSMRGLGPEKINDPFAQPSGEQLDRTTLSRQKRSPAMVLRTFVAALVATSFGASVEGKHGSTKAATKASTKVPTAELFPSWWYSVGAPDARGAA